MKKYIKNGVHRLQEPLFREVNQRLDHMQAQLDNIIKSHGEYLTTIAQQTSRSLEEHERTQNIVKSSHDNLQFLTRELYKIRERPAYNKAFGKNPLITVRIATYNRADLLINRAVKSVLNQTYQNFEIVIVGDHCTDDTEEKIKALKDPRISFYNLPNRTVYPEDRVKKWMVIGTPAMNEAAARAKGEWISALDDDDEFLPSHLETLLKLAQETHCELVYGATDYQDITSRKSKRFWASPPKKGEFTFIGAMYHKALDEIFKNDFHSWMVNEVNDWNLCRRMMESGVRIAATEEAVSKVYLVPAGHKDKEY